MEMLYNIHRTPLENAYFRACLAAHPIYLEAFRYATFALSCKISVRKKINEYPSNLFLVGICKCICNSKKFGVFFILYFIEFLK